MTREGTIPSPWPYRLAVATAASAVPLVLFGGSVTTLGAGMAVEGWLVAEGHFLLLFPVESWFRDTGTFVEHTHRLFGVLVGLLAVSTAALAWARARGAGAWTATAALAAVCGQGALGGFRVLEDSSRLAFLHGFAAQVVFALLCASAVVLSPRWRVPRAEGEEREGLGPARAAALAATAAVLLQVLVGAAYRHALRPTPAPTADALLALHLAGAMAALGAALWLAAALRGAGEAFGGTRRRLVLLVHLQVLLGLVAWVGNVPGAIGPFEWTVSVLHVLGGALLLAQCAAAALRLFRAPAAESRPAPVGSPELGGAR